MGTLDDSGWREVTVAMDYWLRGPGTRAWWVKFGRASFGPEFQALVDNEIAGLDAA
jgi:hypothetical protein